MSFGLGGSSISLCSTELLEAIKLDSREFQHDVLPVISLCSTELLEAIKLDSREFQHDLLPVISLCSTELLEAIKVDSREFQHDVLPVIQQSFKSHNARNNFTFLKAQQVHNAELFSQVGVIFTWCRIFKLLNSSVYLINQLICFHSSHFRALNEKIKPF